jgi:hypothetical protein
MKAFLSRLFGKTKTARNTAKPPAKTRLGVESLDRRDMPSVTMAYHGGPVIPNVQVEAVYLGSAWAYNPSDPNTWARLADRANMDGFLKDIVQSSYMSGLSQYYGYMPGYSALGWVFPGKGQFVKDDVVNVNLGAGPVSEGTVENYLLQEMITGRLDRPDANKLYVVIMPPGVAEAGDLGSGGGHHSTFSVPWLPGAGLFGGQAHFATIEHGLSGFTPEALNVSVTPFQKMTLVTSHELAEAVTDPELNAWYGTYTNWYGGSTTGEIGDVTQDLIGPYGNGALSYEDGYLVQKYWSNNDNTSIAPGGTNY